ncbi:TrkH family potassium uptake protein [Novispirillum sp. DQ9]|uniref:TrkH family potassium uptake protein n=1 Tax=Novispirillum sp. DQ9 TaxID=3398612 RepID=UPI003C7DA76E
MAVPAFADLAVGNVDWQVFAAGSITTIFLGAATALSTRMLDISLSLKQGFMLTTLAWVVLPLAGAIPFVYADLKLGIIDSIFETVSAMTTTGSTVMVGLDSMPPGILLWRSLLQWIGGIGIIVMAIAILPFLRVGGMQLFRTESSDRYDKALPRAGQMVAAITYVYAGLTVACGLSYWAAGMTAFDALNHALTTLPTGGFSTHDASFGYFESPLIQWLGTLFMIAGALPFTLYIATLAGRRKALLRDSQVRLFLGLAVGSTLLLTAHLVWTRGFGVEEALRLSAFNLVSVITTTGFATTDYGTWGPFAATLVFYLTFVGACAGSTTGGIKMLRVGIMVATFSSYIKRLVYPAGVFQRRFGGQEISAEVTASVMVFTLAFAGTIAVTALALSLFGHDFVTSLTAAATAVANVGPGLGPIVGPAGNFAPLEPGAKLVLCAAMILGRLEIFTVFVLFSPVYWRG